MVGIFDFGKTGAGNNSGFEAMCYINEKPYQGVDINHMEVFFPEELCGKRFSLTFRLWSGLEGGGVPREQGSFLLHGFFCLIFCLYGTCVFQPPV